MAFDPLARWNTLKTTKEGAPMVILMGDPNIEGGFLSLVGKGANGRRIQVVKAESLGEALGGPMGNELTPTLGGGYTADAAVGWLSKIFGPLLGGYTRTTKGAGNRPTTFEAAVALPAVMDDLWTATDGLSSAIRNVLMDEEISDKKASILKVLAGFNSHMKAKFGAIPTIKAEDLRDVSSAVRTQALKRAKTGVSKAGRVISGANMGKITAAADAMESALSAIRALQSAGTTKKGHAPDQEDEMKVQVAAQLAAEQAVAVCKAQGIDDAAILAQVGAAASTEVFKMAVTGEPQAAIHTDALAQQRRESRGESGRMAGPEGKFMAAINRGAGSMARKADGTPAFTTDEGALEWLTEQVVAAKTDVDDLATATDAALKPVFKALKVPQASAQGVKKGEDGKDDDDDDDDDKDKDKDKPNPFGKKVKKADKGEADAFAGTALGGF